ncbi:MAG: prolipoprotein diacylglyceryl transferase, partial [Clostridia bacterium]|nr:prolipoprotein diacylglyceryl transferase [Clostridia bacterium]
MYPKPLFTIFGRGVYLYGICLALGIIACFIFLYITMKKKKFNDASIDMIIFIGFFGTAFGIFAAMLFQSVYNYIDNPAAGFHLSGMTFIGGLIGGVVSFLGVYNLYIYVIHPRTKIGWLKPELNATLSDALPFIPIAITIAHAFGRLGCFFGGCCYGAPADWGLYCAGSYDEVTGIFTLGEKVIPTQLFEMCFLLLLGGAMALLYFKFKFNYNFAVYAIAYGIWRFILEFVRDDDRGQFLGTALTPSQFWCIFMVILGVGYVFLQMYWLKKLMRHPELANSAPAPVEEEEKKPAPEWEKVEEKAEEKPAEVENTPAVAEKAEEEKTAETEKPAEEKPEEKPAEPVKKSTASKSGGTAKKTASGTKSTAAKSTASKTGGT